MVQGAVWLPRLMCCTCHLISATVDQVRTLSRIWLCTEHVPGRTHYRAVCAGAAHAGAAAAQAEIGHRLLGSCMATILMLHMAPPVCGLVLGHEHNLAVQGMHEAGYTIVLAGHSLGAGVLALLGLMLRKRGVDRVQGYGFATPPCCTAALAKECEDWFHDVAFRCVCPCVGLFGWKTREGSGWLV